MKLIFHTAALLVPLAVLAPASAQTSDEDRILELDQRWNEALDQGDVESVVDLYAEDGVIMPPGAPQRQGAEAVRGFWSDLMGLPGFALDIQPSSVAVAEAGDMAYDVGTYDLTYDGEGGRVEDGGKYVVVWTKQGDDWKVAADIFNSDGAE